MAKQLTSAAVQRLRPGKERREVRDAGAQGLYLVIQPSGARSWCVRFRRLDGRTAKLVLGSVDLSGRELEGAPEIGMPLSLSAARQLTAEVHRARARGRDVVADRAAAKHRQRSEREANVSNNFAAAARDYVNEHAKKRTRRWQEQARVLGLDPKADGLEAIRGGLAERWADKPVAEIDGHDIWSIVDESRRISIPGLKARRDGASEARAMKMFSTLSRAFGWLARRRRVEKNPCDRVHRPDALPSRDRVLTNDEIKRFWSAASKERVAFAAPLKLLLLTGQRLSEVTGMRRSELSEDGATWTIPSGRTKNKRAHVVPLSPTARELIASMSGDGELVFSTDGAHPVSIGSKIKRRLDAAMRISPWRTHDLRRTTVTGMAELGIRPDVIERVVNHVSGNARSGVAGIYNRSELLSERRAALERWAVHVMGLISGRPAKVLPLHKPASVEA
jgi:integrase